MKVAKATQSKFQKTRSPRKLLTCEMKLRIIEKLICPGLANTILTLPIFDYITLSSKSSVL